MRAGLQGETWITVQTGSREDKITILVEFNFLKCYFLSLVNISLRQRRYWRFCFSQFQDNKASLKQALGHNNENTIFQPRQSYEPIAIPMCKGLQSTYQRKILYHIEVLMQRTEFSFSWACNVTQ